MLLKLLTKKKRSIVSGDYVMLKDKFKHNFPTIPLNVVSKVIEIEQENATISFANRKGQIFEEVLLVKCLYKVG